MSEEIEKIEVLIIGSGPAGYTAGIYASRADLKPVIIQGMQPGGQLTTTTDVDNYPGYADGVLGPKMMEDFQKQAERFGTDVRWGMVTNVDFSQRPFNIEIDEKKNYQDSKLYCYSDIYKHVCPFGTMLKSNASSINASTSQECCELDWEILKVVLPLFVLMLFALWFIKKRTIG